MNTLLSLVLALQILTALAMIGLILVQHGKGADMGAAFGSGGSGSLFGASGSANFLSRATGVLATLFFACTLLLAYFGNTQSRPLGSSVLDNALISAPAAPTSVPPQGAQVPGSSVPPTVDASVPAPAAPVAPATEPAPAK